MSIEIDEGYLRVFGGVPKSFPDERLAPHVRSAILTVQALLREREPQNEAEEERVRMAMGCYAMAYALPVLNTFYLSRAEMVPRQIAQTDYVFHDANDIMKLVSYWKSRAYEELREVGRTGGTVGVAVI
jgi:hypothetical protein